MSVKKLTSWTWAFVHAGFYSLPYAVLLLGLWLVGGSTPLCALLAWGVIFSTHAAIDRLQLAGKYVVWWGVGHRGLWWREEWTRAEREAAAREWYEMNLPSRSRYVPWQPFGNSEMQEEARRAAGDGFKEPPPFLSVWLKILVDNTMHLCINAAAIWLALFVSSVVA